MDKDGHMSFFGVGPIYVGLIAVLTIIAIYISRLDYFLVGVLPILKFPLLVVGILLISLGIFLWIQAVIVSKLDRNIANNKLVTTGAYAWVRNPIYSAFAISFTGILCLQNNLFLFIVPFIYWTLMSVLVKKEEIILEKLFKEDYVLYKSNVNRCIPWPPKKNPFTSNK